MAEENQKIQKISRLLEKGGTMLATHHECGAPMFRYQGKVLCPVCDFQEKPEEPGKRGATVKKEIRETPEISADIKEITGTIKNKINVIASGLGDETDLARVKEKLECIELGLKVLKLLET